MRKRQMTNVATAEPQRCGHPMVTIDGVTAYACSFGRPGRPFPLESIGTPDGDVAEEAWGDHYEWQPGPIGLRWVVREELLDPEGKPWAWWEAGE